MPDPTLLAAATAAAQQYGVPVDLFINQITQESGFNPNPASNPAWPQSQGGPVGIAQFTAATAAQYGVNPTDPISSLYGAAKYDADLFAKSGNWANVLKSYGTVPSSGNLTPSQSALLAQAQSISGGGTGSNGSNPLLQNVSGFLPQGVQNALNGIGSFFWDLFMRIVVILIGIVLIWQGLAMMRGTSVTEDVNVVVNNSKRGAKNAGATVAKAA